MHRIDGAGHVGNLFVAEDLSSGRPPTEISAEWMNDVQENIVDLILAAGINLEKGKYTQLRDGIEALMAPGSLAKGVNRVVDDVEALKHVDSKKYQRVFVLGYYAPGDGGGGEYWCDLEDKTTADNGGTVFVAEDGARWKLICHGLVSVKQFGAKGDGVSDDYPRIQAATDAVVSLFFPNGTYILSHYIREATNARGTRFVGENEQKTIIKSAANYTNSVLIWFGNSSGHGVYYGDTENLTIDGHSSWNNHTGLLLQSAGLSKIRNVTFRNCGRPAWLHGCINTQMQDCHVFDCWEGPYWDKYPMGVPASADDLTVQANQTTSANQSSMVRVWLSGLQANGVYICGGNFVLDRCVFQSCTNSPVHDVVRVVDSNESFDYGGGPIITNCWVEGGTYRYAVHIETTRQTRLFNNHINGAFSPSIATMEGAIWMDAMSSKNIVVRYNSIRGYFTAPTSYAANAAVYVTASNFSYTADIGPNYIVSSNVEVYWEGLTSPTVDRSPLNLCAAISINNGAQTVDFQSANFIHSILKNGVGDFTVVYKFNRQPLASGKYPVMALTHTNGGGITYSVSHIASNPGNDRFIFNDDSGALADPAGFTLQLLCGGWQQV